jgi:hypothetical protein
LGTGAAVAHSVPKINDTESQKSRIAAVIHKEVAHRWVHWGFHLVIGSPKFGNLIACLER